MRPVSVSVVILVLYIHCYYCSQRNKCSNCQIFNPFINVMHWDMSVYLLYVLSYIYTDLIIHQGLNVLTDYYFIPFINVMHWEVSVSLSYFLSYINTDLIIYQGLSNSYSMGCPPVRGDNPRALASGLSYVQVDKHGITILYHLHQCRPCTSSDISC